MEIILWNEEGSEIVIQAVLEGKSLNYQYSEDILTSTVFGTIKYLKPDTVLIPFIEAAFLYDEGRTTLWERLNSEGIELRCYRNVEYVFWAWNQTYGEPDLILIFRDHIHGGDDFLLVVEAKFKSGKSGTDENDQLARYFEAINNDIENFSDASVSNFKGKKAYIVYVTEAEAYSDISASNKIISSKYTDIEDNVFHLRWHQLYKTFESMYQYYSSYEKILVDDLMQYLEKLGLRDFSGFSIPDEYLYSTFLSPYPIFYNESTGIKNNKYFDQLKNGEDFKFESKIFFGGK